MNEKPRTAFRHAVCDDISDVRKAARQADTERMDPGPVHPDWSGQSRTSIHHDCWMCSRRRGEL